MVLREKLSGPRREPIGGTEWNYFRELASAIKMADRCRKPVLDMSFRKIYERKQG